MLLRGETLLMESTSAPFIWNLVISVDIVWTQLVFEYKRSVMSEVHTYPKIWKIDIKT